MKIASINRGITSSTYCAAVSMIADELLVNGRMKRFIMTMNRMMIVNGCQKFLKSVDEGERWFAIPKRTKKDA